eukprot:3662886-Pyramimonas_sp.AAC.1
MGVLEPGPAQERKDRPSNLPHRAHGTVRSWKTWRREERCHVTVRSWEPWDEELFHVIVHSWGPSRHRSLLGALV